MRTLRKLLLGETWSLPAGLGAVVAGAALVARPLLGGAWASLGGFAVLAGTLVVLLVSVDRSARRSVNQPRPSRGHDVDS